MKTTKQEIRNRWTNAVQFTADITCAPDATIGVRIGLAVRWARNNDANLSNADLRGADLSGVDLSGVDLIGVDLSGADLRYAVLSGANPRFAVLSGANLRNAVLSGADLRYADLSNADLSGADLRGADLSGADLSNADLRGADLSGVPVIENIHQKVYQAASQPGALDMGDWHICETTHCRAGWVVTLADDEGKALEDRIGTPAAASLIYLASDPDIGLFPDFYCSNKAALADMKERAEAEAAKVSA